MSKDKFKSKMKGQGATSSFGDVDGIHKNIPEDKIYQPTGNDWIKPQKESKNIAAYYYHLPSKTLYLRFQNERAYYYKNFKMDDYNNLVIADRTEESFGSWISKQIVQQFQGIKLI